MCVAIRGAIHHLLACSFIIASIPLLAISTSLYILYCWPIGLDRYFLDSLSATGSNCECNWDYIDSKPGINQVNLSSRKQLRKVVHEMRFFLLALSFLLLAPQARASDDLFSDQGLFTDDSFFNDKAKPKTDSGLKQQLIRENSKRAFYQAWEDADNQLFQQMRQVGNWINDWISMNHRFAEVGDESHFAARQLDALLVNNPYDHSSVSAQAGIDKYAIDDEVQENPQPGVPNVLAPHRVKFVRDFGLSTAQIEVWSEEPPVEWREAPGVITMMTNDQNLFCIWGAGADGRPIRDYYSHRTRLCVGDYSKWDTQPMDLQLD